MIEPPSLRRGRAFCTVKEQPLHVHVEGLVKMGLRRRGERCDRPRACVREENVDVTMFLFHDGIEPIQILQARHVAHDRRHVFARDKARGLFQLLFLVAR